jgi:hypothetical protein
MSRFPKKEISEITKISLVLFGDIEVRKQKFLKFLYLYPTDISSGQISEKGNFRKHQNFSPTIFRHQNNLHKQKLLGNFENY